MRFTSPTSRHREIVLVGLSFCAALVAISEMKPLTHRTREPAADAGINLFEPEAAGGDLHRRGNLQEAVMNNWHDTMVDRPETDGAVYATGWTIAGLAVLGAIVAVWVLGI